jgi:hypothetical protein
MGTLHDDKYMFLTLSCPVLLRMKKVSDKSCRQNQNKHFMFHNFFFNCDVCEILWKTFVEPGMPQLTIWCMGIACWIPNPTNTHSDYVILLQQWLHEHTSMLCCTHFASLVTTNYTHTSGGGKINYDNFVVTFKYVGVTSEVSSPIC